MNATRAVTLRLEAEDYRPLFRNATGLGFSVHLVESGSA